MAPTSKSSKPSPAQIESDLAAVRARLASSVEALVDQVHPSRIKQRQVASLKEFAAGEVDVVKAQVFDHHGDLRTGRLVAAAGAVAGVITFLALVRKIVSRRKH